MTSNAVIENILYFSGSPEIEFGIETHHGKYQRQISKGLENCDVGVNSNILGC